MDKNWPIVRIADVFQHRQQMIEVVAIDWSDIINTELFEQRSARPEIPREFLGLAGPVINKLRQVAPELLCCFAHGPVGAAGYEARQISRQGAGWRRNRHIIVVKNDDEARMHRASIVHRFIGHAGGHRTIADDGDDVGPLARQRVGHRHAKPGGNRSGRMRRAERIVFAFGAFGEAGQAATPAQGSDPVAPAGEYLMGIGLVADVPNYPVIRRIENIMQGNRELDHAQSRAEMTARYGDRVDRLSAQFVGDLSEISFVQAPQIGG